HQPYFAMEFVQGRPLTEYATARELSIRQRLLLFMKVCEGVDHAHKKGVIHRDLKPSNIFVVDEAESAMSGQPKILDFGIARSTDADIHTATRGTDVGQLIGTIAYMSPEQIDGDPAHIDTRCDVYALGVVVYELLAG